MTLYVNEINRTVKQNSQKINADILNYMCCKQSKAYYYYSYLVAVDRWNIVWRYDDVVVLNVSVFCGGGQWQ